ncbi:MAG: hypothetical protein WD894_25430 [Pirellulales bacterium]
MSFSIKWLLCAVAFIAVSLAALLNANELWRIGCRSAVVLTVLIAIAGALWSSGKSRAFYGGYVLFALAFYTNLFGDQSEFITGNALTAIHQSLFEPTSETVTGSFHPVSYNGDVLTVIHQKDSTLLVTAIRPKRLEFLGVGHAIFSVAWGVIGGYVAMGFYSRRESKMPFSSMRAIAADPQTTLLP